MNNLTKIIIETKDSNRIPKYNKYSTLIDYINKFESNVDNILTSENDIYKVYLNRKRKGYDKRLEFHNFSNLKNIWEIEFVLIENWIEKIFPIPEVIKSNFKRYLEKWYPLKAIKNTRWTLNVYTINCEYFANILLWHDENNFDNKNYDFNDYWDILWLVDNESELIPWDVILTTPKKLTPSKKHTKLLRYIKKGLPSKDKKDLLMDITKDRSKLGDFHFAVYLWNNMFISKMWWQMEVSITDLHFLRKRFDIWSIIRLKSKK